MRRLTLARPVALKCTAQAVAIVLAAAAGSAFAQATADNTPRPKDDVVRLGTITVVGDGDKLGAGLILKEDAVKARSTVTKESTDKDRATGNPYQAISLLPGVNSFNHDATGLFGGGMTMRGFSADQIGFTINGVPVNDSGNFAVFPQEYVDQENTCLQSVTQGNGDVEAPHVGSTGGSVGITACDPLEKTRIRLSQTLGGLKLSRTFARFDTGRVFDNKAKFFVSYSHTQANKWKGEGEAKRDHFDAGFSWDISASNKVLGSVMYNRAINNNIQTLSLAQLNANGGKYDFSATFQPGHLTGVKGTAQNETGPNPAYYKLATNPFENMIASLSGSFKLSADATLKVQPYYWFGYGTGGTQQRVQSEAAFLNKTTGTLTGAGRDINGDGDTLDRVIWASSSITRTTRPGITTELNYSLGQHQIKAGYWFERARHEQTGPAVAVDAQGNSADLWLRSGRFTRADGSDFQSRDWVTVSPASQLYVSDNVTFANDAGNLQLGVRAPRVTRKFTNNASEGQSANPAWQRDYYIEKTFSEVLPQVGVRYNLSAEQQVFANIGKNFRAPPNFAFGATGNVFLLNGVPTLLTDVKAETSVSTDMGYRFQSSGLTLSGNFFHVSFKDRQGNSFDPNLNQSLYTNVGSTSNRGLELEFGTPAVNGFTFYGSFTAQRSKVLNDIIARSPTGAPIVIPTKDKQFTLTPETLAGLSVQYVAGPLYTRLKVKHTGPQKATLLNDESVPSYNVMDLDAGYNLGNRLVGKNAQLRFNISNLGNESFVNPSSGTVINAKPVGAAAASTVFYYLGAPRMMTLTLTADF